MEQLFKNLNISPEREEELIWLWDNETEEPETQEWREDLTADEAVYVEQWEKQFAIGIRSLLERQQDAAEANTTQQSEPDYEPEL